MQFENSFKTPISVLKKEFMEDKIKAKREKKSMMHGYMGHYRIYTEQYRGQSNCPIAKYGNAYINM